MLSFLTELPSYYPIEFPMDYPIIAVFYADVDCRGSGRITYRLIIFRKSLFDHFEFERKFFEEKSFKYFWKCGEKRDFLKMINLYRSTSDSDLLRRVQNDLKLGFPGARRFQPTEVFIATWNEVGYYEEKSNKVVQI